MDFSIDERDGVAIVRIRDDITTDNIQEFRDFFTREVNPRYSKVVIDMTDVDYFCSAAYGVMLRCLEKTRGNGGDLVLANAGESVRRLFQVTRLTSVIKLMNDEEAALRYLSRNSSRQ